MRSAGVRIWADHQGVSDTGRRLLALLGRLQDGRAWSAADLAGRLGVGARTVRRDVVRLRELGYPVIGRPGPGGSYRLAAGSRVPPLVLEDDEVVAVAVGLRQAAGALADAGATERAAAKLDRLLPARLREAVRAVSAATEAVPAGGARAVVTPGLVQQLARAIADHRSVTFTYAGRSGAQADRSCDPHRLVAEGIRWYLVAFDHDRDDWRTFRLDRVDQLVVGEVFSPRHLPALTAAEHVRSVRSAPRYEVVVEVAAPAAHVAGRLGIPGEDVQPVDHTSCTATLTVDSAEWLITRMLTLDADWSVQGPDPIRQRCSALLARHLHDNHR